MVWISYPGPFNPCLGQKSAHLHIYTHTQCFSSWGKLVHPSVTFFFSVYLFIYFEKEGERGGERIPSRLCATGAPNMGLNLTDCEGMTWAQIESWTLSQLSHPGIPINHPFMKCPNGLPQSLPFIRVQNEQSRILVLNLSWSMTQAHRRHGRRWGMLRRGN